MRTWDYIVIGAGSAGCVVARRLSDDPNVSVLLIEAGGQADSFWVGVPAGMARVIGDKRYDWRFTTEPNAGLNGRRLQYPRGKALGGSSAINGLVYTRGNRRDYDHWASLQNPGWAWDDVLPYFRKLEDNQRGENSVRGAGGPQKVSDNRLRSAANECFIAAAKQCGVPEVEDLSVVGEEGVGVLQATSFRGKRHTAFDGYLRPVLNRSNLTIIDNCLVCSIEVKDGRATGVKVIRDGASHVLRARAEIVLSAGAIGSPQILLLSGVGAGAQLHNMGIEPRLDLPGVGQNLQDHFSVHQKYDAAPGWSGNARINGWRKYVEGARWLFARSGYLASSATPVAAFVKSSPDMDYADLEIGFRPISFSHTPERGAEIDALPAVSASVYRVRPDSRGQVQLRSPHPTDQPAIETNFLSAATDLAATIAGMRKIRDIMAAPAISGKILRETQPGASAETDEQLEAFIRETGKTSYHPVGTCRMGADQQAVVDARLRVRGLAGLRVIDASIMPTPSSGNTAAASMMIGEKGAAMMIEDARMKQF